MANYSKVFEILKKHTTDENIDIIWSALTIGTKGVYIMKPVNEYGTPSIIMGCDLQKNPEKGCFVLAHELGHHTLHSENFDRKLYYFGDQKNENYIKLIEAEADAFAKGIIRGIKLGLAKETLLKNRPQIAV